MAHSTSEVKRFAPLLSALGLLLALFGWALASPVGATPDEDFHLVSIWCASDANENMCQDTSSEGTRIVNSALLHAACYAQQPKESADCQLDKAIFESTTPVETSRGNFSGSYPQGFYATMNLFAGDDIQVSVLAMRLFNGTLFVAVLSALWFLLPTFLRSSVYFTVALTVVPLGLFLIPSINPSSWAIMGVLTTFFGAVGALQKEGRGKFILAGIALFGLILAASSRYDGFIYAVVALGAAFILAKRFTIPRKIFWISLAAVGFISMLALAFGGVGIIERLAGLAGNSSENADGGALGVFATNVRSLPMLWAGFSGAMGLGWLDTILPHSTWMIAATLLWGAMFMRVGQMKKTQFWVSASVTALLILVPLLVLQASLAIVGENVQSRYLYPLLLVLASAAFFRSRGDAQYFSREQLFIVTLGLFVSQAFAIYTNMSRYISGAGVGGFSWNLNTAAQDGWWWPAAPSPMFVLALSIIGFGAFLATAFLFKRSRPSLEEPVISRDAVK